MKSHQNSVTTAILVAAGRGLRAGGGIPKQWRPIAGQSVAAWTLNVFQAHPQVDHIVVVTNDDDPHANNILDMFDGIRRVSGGHSRGASVHNGLLAAPEGTTHVLVHDIARPCISGALISKIIASIASNMCAAPALPVTDALWRGRDGGVEGTQERENLYRAQTPQGFALDAILDAHAQFSGPAADDVEVARAAGHRVAIVPGDEANIKITTEQDFDRAEQILAARYAGEKKMDIRVGNGFDVHQFTEGDHVTLCGVDIPHTHRLKGHSDADVGLHTITDAIYGALAQGDIGTHFPPSDPQWKGAASHIFLEHARDLAAKMGFSLTHVDCTLICEMPKIGPNALTMRQKVSEILNISLDRISVKATTSEGLGFTGRGEGIACMATATLVKTS